MLVKGFEKVVVVYVPVIAIGHVQVLPGIVVGIEEKSRPTPVGFVNSGQLGHIAEGAVAIVLVEEVAHLVISVAQAVNEKLELIHRLHRHDDLFTEVVFAKHFHHDHIGEEVVVQVTGVNAHAAAAGLLYCGFAHIAEGTITIVVKDEVGFVVVHGEINVGPAVGVEVRGDHAQAKAIGKDARIRSHIGKVAVIVSEQPAAEFQNGVNPVVVMDGRRNDAVAGVVGHDEVQVSVAVVIEEGSGDAVIFVGNAEFGGPLGESAIAVVLKKEVALLCGVVVIGAANVNIEPAVIVYIGYGYACTPVFGLKACFLGNVFEAKMAFVEEKFGGHHVAGHYDVLQPVIVKIADADPAAVVGIDITEGVDQLFFIEDIVEKESAFFRFVFHKTDRTSL